MYTSIWHEVWSLRNFLGNTVTEKIIKVQILRSKKSLESANYRFDLYCIHVYTHVYIHTYIFVSLRVRLIEGKMGGEEERKKRVAVESLGWLTESSIMPKKHRAIEGVGPSSIMELKAQLYMSQEESKKSKDLSGSDVQFHRAKQRIAAHDSFSAKNSGVEARARKDKLELKAVKDGSAGYAALEKKAELYEKLVRGELSDEEDKEKYCVDFFRKGIEQEETQPSSDARDGSGSASAPLEDMKGDGEDDGSLFNTRLVGPGRNVGTVDRSEHVRMVREVHEEVNQAREKVSELKQRRQEQATVRREKLRQAYLRKQLEKLKAQKQQGQGDL